MIDIAGELSARRGERFDEDTQAVRNLAGDARFPAELVRELERLPGFRNVVVHDYVGLDMDRVVEAIDRLEPLERFGRIVQDIEAASETGETWGWSQRRPRAGPWRAASPAAVLAADDPT
jgi:uncharacterized protein YutE (UPF0331/DUF86 family)